MSTIFLGNPKPSTKQYIIDHYYTPTSQWDNIVQSLEHFSDSMIGNELPMVGSTTLSTMYDIGDGQIIPLTWQVLGYNSSIPKYVKYKDASGNKIYVSSMKPTSNGDIQGYLLSAIVENDPVYVKNADGEYETNGQTIDQNGVSQEIFTYGQDNAVWGTLSTDNGSYSVPSKISVDNNEYVFAGYNMTIVTAGTIGVVKDGIYYNHVDFFAPYAYYINDWSGSQIRAWLNGNNNVDLSQQMWKYYDDNYYEQTQTTGNVLPKFTTRFDADNGFLDNVVQVVNRTWVWGTATWNTLWNKKVLDNNKCEHISDKFWLLGVGSVNCSGSNTSQYFNGYQYETAIYSSIFGNTDIWTSSNSRKRFQMNVDGSMSSVARIWRLRSAYSDTDYESYSRYVGDVNGNGYVYNDYANSADGGALLPACTIG